MGWADAEETLRRFQRHLDPGGLLVLTSYNPWDELKEERVGEWEPRGREALPDGSELETEARVDARHPLDQTLDGTVRYRRHRNGQVVEEQYVSAPERWYFAHELTLMLERAGFREVRVTGNYSDAPAADDDYVLAFFADV